MKLKYIAAAAAFLASASSFAIVSSDTGDGGLFLAVTDQNLSTPESYDLDLNLLTSQVVTYAGTAANGFTTQTWTVNAATDAAFAQLLSDASAAGIATSSLDWVVEGAGNNGPVTKADSYQLLTTVADGQTATPITNSTLSNGISSGAASGVSRFDAEFSNVEVNHSALVQEGTSFAYFGDSSVANLQDNLMGYGPFSQLNAVGAQNVAMAYYTNTPAKGNGVVSFEKTGVFTASFNISNGVGTLTLETAPVPEPGTYAMVLAGLAVVGLLAKRRQAA